MPRSAQVRGQGQLHIGCSGFHYSHWRGRFYPADLAEKDWFRFYAEQFSSLEINSTFYGLPSPTTVREWRDRAPPGFRFAVKMSRYATHFGRLKEPEQRIGRFLERVELLRVRLGPILVQLPPRWRPELERLDAWLAAAPVRHRWAVEVRDRRWLGERLFEILEHHGAALVIHDMLSDHPRRLTSDWTYLRFHGDGYQGSYSPQALTAQARRIANWLAECIDVYAYFNNDYRACAPRNALALRRYLGNALGPHSERVAARRRLESARRKPA